MSTQPNICDICHLPIPPMEPMRGHGDGTGQKFAHNDCWWREEAEKWQKLAEQYKRDAEYAEGLLECYHEQTEKIRVIIDGKDE